MKFSLSLLTLSIVSCLVATPVRYDGYEVHRITPHTKEQLSVLRQLENNTNFNFWTGVSIAGKDVDIMVPPNLTLYFQNFTKRYNLKDKLWIEDVQQRIDNEKPKGPRLPGWHDWKDYQTLEEIYEWLKFLALRYPYIVDLLEGGRSYEGREIRGVRVSYGPGNDGVFIEGGSHACEWISPATVTYILNQLITSTNLVVREAAASRDWYIFPCVNPDGYVYSHLTDRLWKKTRKPYGGDCYGANLNRNWDYHWMEGGASTSPCSVTYAGNASFSEIETRTLAEYISNMADGLDIYLAFHSYSQMILIPFGYEGNEVPENNHELHRVAKVAAKGLAGRYGTKYAVGNMREVGYTSSGGSTDWVLGKHRGITLVYSYELREQEKYGFILPSDQIIPTAEETLDSIVEIIAVADGLTVRGSATYLFVNFAVLSVVLVNLIKMLYNMTLYCDWCLV